MDYDLYHDESKLDGYWHGMLLVPKPKRQWMLDRLADARANARYSEPLGIKRVRKENRVFDCAKSWLTVAIASMRSTAGGEPVPIYLGKSKRGVPQYRLVEEAPGAKFILFRESDAHQEMTSHPDHASKIETTFRIGLKGGLHFLGSEQKSIWIDSLHFDGHEHLKRNVDASRIIGRLEGLRSYCHIPDKSDILHDGSSDHRRPDAQSYDDCQFLQLTDLLVGSFRTVLLGATNDLHLRVAYPVESLVLRYQEGYARMKNSRWWSSFCMSQCHLEDDHWVFETMEYEPYYGAAQIALPLQTGSA